MASITTEGYRDSASGIIGLRDKTTQGAVLFTSDRAKGGAVNQLFNQVCITCPVFGRACLGVAKIDVDGQVIADNEKPIREKGCIIPGQEVVVKSGIQLKKI